MVIMSDFASIDWQKDSSNTQEAAIDQMSFIFTRDLHLPRNYIIHKLLYNPRVNKVFTSLHFTVATSVVANPGICLSPMFW